MEEYNPLSGREKQETTYQFTTDGNSTISRNWGRVSDLISDCSEDDEVAFEPIDQGFLLRAVPANDVLSLIEVWEAAPHARNGYSLRQMANFINASLNGGELERWSVFLPSRRSASAVDMRDSYDEQQDHPPLQEIKGYDFSGITPFRMLINGSHPTAGGRRFRIGSITTPSWRMIDLQSAQWPRPENSDPLLIITSFTHPFNRQNPISTNNYQGGGTQWLSGIADQHWPTVPSLSLCFPESNLITQAELGHSQFNQN